MCRLRRNTQGAVERQGKCPEGVKRRQKSGQNCTVIKPLIDGLAGAELLIAPGRERALFGRAVVRLLNWRATMSPLMIDRMNLVVDRRQHGVFAPEPRERKHTRQRQAADEKRG